MAVAGAILRDHVTGDELLTAITPSSWSAVAVNAHREMREGRRRP